MSTHATPHHTGARMYFTHSRTPHAHQAHLIHHARAGARTHNANMHAHKHDARARARSTHVVHRNELLVFVKDAPVACLSVCKMRTLLLCSRTACQFMYGARRICPTLCCIFTSLEFPAGSIEPSSSLERGGKRSLPSSTSNSPSIPTVPWSIWLFSPTVYTFWLLSWFTSPERSTHEMLLFCGQSLLSIGVTITQK